ncbi:hypothetical protein CPSG_06383 [Coccidioides posadasii str. Silveira]|uniref:Uncharacterized protein n=1 Tax=Coccidioides posadasii (strain RMSCC 757 / Silveira) TaxID=443226 RepID=E9D981_COCPS|nr:hypothetical protein CPSG_06383 [Coccidioides posadasii str. Silveira]
MQNLSRFHTWAALRLFVYHLTFVYSALCLRGPFSWVAKPGFVTRRVSKQRFGSLSGMSGWSCSSFFFLLLFCLVWHFSFFFLSEFRWPFFTPLLPTPFISSLLTR